MFKPGEASYLAGIMAASVSKTGTIGFIGGKQVPVLEEFLAGYEAGALAANPDIKIVVIWTGTFGDQQKGREAAHAVLAQNADVTYTAAATTGLGVFPVIADAGKWMIGVDADQNYLAPDAVITSVIKNVGKVASDNVHAIVDGTWKPGTAVYNLANDGVGLAPYHGLAGLVPDKIQAQIDEAKRAIVSGSIKVPTKPEFPTGKN
jgi:basic membrane protein A and related proteins